MVDCECLAGCPFFNNRMKNLPGASEVLKKKYCRGGQYESCARYKVYKVFGKGNVPQDLSPMRVDIAERLVAEKEAVCC